MPLRTLLTCAAACMIAATIAPAQDAVKVDPKHYKVETENSQVRVLRIHYDPHEKSVMHSHPDSVVIYLTDGSIRFTSPDGKTEEAQAKAGQTQYTPAQVHDPENIGDKPFEAILVELKGGKAAARAKSPKK